jgi:high-affinity nickel-transport protein
MLSTASSETRAPEQGEVGHRPTLRRTQGLFALLIGLNLCAWIWAVAVLHNHPALLGAAMLAWVFGLRHAVDADHIAAIDNVVRKLMQSGRPAETVGLWFSLGHSTVVVMASLAVAGSAVALQRWLGPARQIGDVAGTLVSAAFLFAIAASNLVVLRAVWRAFLVVKRGGRLDQAPLDAILAGRGLLARLLGPLFAAIRNGWQMYPLGFLFGLGFDTATEIGILGISATQASQGVSPWQIMVFPALFTAGMALVDTTDSVLMVHAYGWAFVNPLRKLWYNLTITSASIAVALLIGGVEALGLLGARLALKGRFWTVVSGLNGSFGDLGFAVLAVFGLCWISSIFAYRLSFPDRR